ncbi:acetyltransferase [Cohnella sp. GCM10027633]|uniref:acetyltransferase n=1 Tax=unclassified Cohnella TaxID=2636738 RepID=UPI003627F4A7
MRLEGDSDARLVIIGAGGHARVAADCLKHRYDIVGCTARGSHPSGPLLVLGDDGLLPELRRQGIPFAFVAIGDNALRRKLGRQAVLDGFELATAISPFAYIADRVTVGKGTAVMAGAILQPDTVVGELSIINTGASVDHDGRVGACCHIAPGCNISGGVTIGDGAFLGTGTKVIDGISIGEGAVIGAGAVVVRDIPAYTLAMGVPARAVKSLEQKDGWR